MVALGMYLFVVAFSTPHGVVGPIKIPEAHAENNPQPQTGQSPSKQPASASDLANYSVPADHPKFLVIPKLHVYAKVVELGINSANNEIAVPTSLKNTGWYKYSSLPTAKNGTTLIVGHIGPVQYPGVFQDLYQLKPGDTIEVILGDNSIKQYSVADVKSVPVKHMNMGDYLRTTGNKTGKLVLMTCTGSYDWQISRYTERLVVTAQAD